MRRRFTQTVAPSDAAPLRVLAIVDGTEAGWDRLDRAVDACLSANALLTVSIVPSRLVTIAISSSVVLPCAYLLGQMNEETEREVNARVPHSVGLTICRRDDPHAAFGSGRTPGFDLVLCPRRGIDLRGAVRRLRESLAQRGRVPAPLEAAPPVGAGSALSSSGR